MTALPRKSRERNGCLVRNILTYLTVVRQQKRFEKAAAPAAAFVLYAWQEWTHHFARGRPRMSSNSPPNGTAAADFVARISDVPLPDDVLVQARKCLVDW